MGICQDAAAAVLLAVGGGGGGKRLAKMYNNDKEVDMERKEKNKE